MRKNIPVILAASLALFVSAAPVKGATLRVPENYKTIQSAVASAADNDLIIIGKGSYKENIVIKKPLQLRGGKGAEATVITAANKTEPVFKIDGASNVLISGFTATGSDTAGISLNNATFCRIANNILTDNANGLMSYASNKNNISENMASFNAQYGIYLETSNYNNVSNNTANSNGDKGILLSSSSANTVVGNDANLNTWNGIVLWASHGNQIKENKALRNTYAIVMGDSDDNEVSDNSTWPNLFVILPIILVYLGIVNYLVQKNIMKLMYKA
jgi:parallel beta-helix repeat protein